MILKKLYLKNFLIHDNTEIEFSEKGITVFIGENGAGKSSILEGLTFALFGKSDKGNQANLVKWGRNQATVVLEFQKGNSIYKIERTITARGSRASSTGTVYLKKGERFVPYYQKNITKEIPKLTGITNKIFSSSILVKQGDIEGLLKLSPKDRGKVLEEILDMTLYQLLSEKAGEKRRFFQAKKEAIESSLPDIGNIEEKEKQLEKEKENLEKERKEIEKELSKEKEVEEKIQSQIESILKEKAEYEKKISLIESLKSQLSQIKEEILRNEELLEQIKEKEKQLPELERTIKELKKMEDLIKKFDLIEKITEKLFFIKEKLENLKEKEKILNEYEDIYKTYLEYEKKYKEIIGKLNKISKLIGQIETIKTQINKLKEERKISQENALKIAKELQNFKRIYKTLELNPVIIDQLIRNNKEAIEHYTKEKERLLKELTELETEGKQFKKEIQELEKLKGNCPTCKRPIEEHTKEELLKELKKNLEEKRQLYKEKKEELKKIEEKLTLEKKLPEYLEAFKREYEKHIEVNNQISELQSKLFVLEREISKKEELEKEKADIERFIQENKEKYQLYLEAERLLKKENVSELEEKYKELLEKEKILKKEIEGIDKEKTLEKFEEIKEKEKVYIALKEFVKQKSSVEKQLEAYKEKEKKILAEISNLQSQIKEKPFQDNLEEKKNELKEIEKRISFLTKDLLEQMEKLGNIEGELRRIEKEKEKFKELQKKIQKLEKKIKKYEKIEFALGTKGIQKIIRENALYKLPKIVNIIFSSFDFPFTQIRFSENFDISLLVPTVEKEDRYIDINAISGGQRVALGLALRIAISRFLSSKADFLILDEPTIHLDNQRRSDLINILIDLKEKNLVNQLILVTHDTEIEDAADTIYYVESGKVRLVS